MARRHDKALEDGRLEVSCNSLALHETPLNINQTAGIRQQVVRSPGPGTAVDYGHGLPHG